jgi:hypothetical protein
LAGLRTAQACQLAPTWLLKCCLKVVELPDNRRLLSCLLATNFPALQVLHDTIFDEFVVAHTVGWWAKALIIRNYTML